MGYAENGGGWPESLPLRLGFDAAQIVCLLIRMHSSLGVSFRLIHDVYRYCVRTREGTSCILGMTEDPGRMLTVTDEDIIG